MAATDLGSSPEPDVPILVSQTSSDQTISLGDKSRGLPGLLTPETSSHGSGWRERNSLRGETIAEQLQSSGGAEAEDDDDEKYNISEFTDGGFILTTTRDYEPEEERSSGEEGADLGENETQLQLQDGGPQPTSSVDSNQATSEYRQGGSRAGSTLSSPNSMSGDDQRDSNVLMMSHDGMSGSSSEDSLSAFDRGGHQGSYVIRKGARKTRGLSPFQPTSDGNRDILTSGGNVNVAVTPMQSLDRSQQGLLNFSSSEESLNDAFERDKTHRSLVLKRGARKTRGLSPFQPTSEGNRDILTSGGNVNVAVTPMQSLDRSQQGLLNFSSSEESLNDAFERDKTHRSLVLKRGKRPAIPSETVFTNHGAVIASTEGEAEGEGGDTPNHEENGDDPEGGEPIVLHRDIRDRIQRSLHAFDSDDEPGYTCNPPCLVEPSVPPDLQKLKRIGFKMAPHFFFPALPKLLQDVWVAIELFVVFFEFTFACVTFGSGGVVNILVVVLTLVNLVLASVDGFLYFVEGGSCVSLFKWGRKQVIKKKGSYVKKKELPQGSDQTVEKERSSGGHFRERVRRMFATGSEVVRIALTELLLYPLTVLDIFELIDSQTYRINSRGNRINFGLVNIGLFYLVLTVYLIRILMSVSAIVSISRLPKTTNSSYHNLLKRFSIHLISQIFVHMVILVMVATKIDSERCVSVEFEGSGSGDNITTTTSVNISPFLYVTIFAGDLIPFLGVAMFFVVNYPGLKEFMIGFCIDMVSTIVSEGFAGTAEGIKNVKKKTGEVHDKVNLGVAQQQFNKYKNVFSLKRKLAYRLTNVFVVSLSGAYFTLITVFLICHTLGWSDACDSNSTVRFISFNDHSGTLVTFIIGLAAITIANYQVVTISVIWLLALSGLVLLVVTLPFVVLLLAPLIAVILLVKSCL